MKYPNTLTSEQVTSMISDTSSAIAKAARRVCKDHDLSACVSTKSDFLSFVKDVTTLTSDKDLEHAMFSKVKWGLYDTNDLPAGKVDKEGIHEQGWTLSDVKKFRENLIRTMMEKKAEKKAKKAEKQTKKRPVDKKEKHVPKPSSAKAAKAKLSNVKPPVASRSKK
jgi:hypothetical protein